MSDDEIRNVTRKIVAGMMDTLKTLQASATLMSRMDMKTSDAMFIGALITAIDMTYFSVEGIAHVVKTWQKVIDSTKDLPEVNSLLNSIKSHGGGSSSSGSGSGGVN